MTTFPFGKHKGRPLADVPLDYLTWLVEQGTLYDPLKSAVGAELDRRAATPRTARPDRLHAISSGGRAESAATVSARARGAAEALLDASRGQLVLALQAVLAVVL